MNRKCNILIPIGCRSDEGLSKPIIKRLEKCEWCVCHTLELEPAKYIESYGLTQECIDQFSVYGTFDIVLITGDRIEMMVCAQCCFLNNIKIAHFYAGILNYPLTTLDDINRHCITLWSDIAFCEDYNSTEVVYQLWNQIGKIGKHWNWQSYEDFKIYNVGISHLDDLEVDESFCLLIPYDLILYNPLTLKKEKMEEEIKYIHSIIDKKKAVFWIGPNPDLTWDQLPIDMYKYTMMDLPRPQFLGLLKNCQRFITNSSSAYYEAPFFLKPEQIIQVGLRNKNRSTPKRLETGASDKIVKILSDLYKRGDFD